MKCCNSAFIAQGSRLIIIVVLVGSVKIYVAAVEALRKKGMTR
jgi:hypothetical protein